MTESTKVARAQINLPTDINAEIAAEMEAMAKRISAPSGNKIQVTQGKKFKFPDGAEVSEFEGVIVDFVAVNKFYEEAYDRNNITPPLCYAVNLEPSAMAPTDLSPDKQSETCGTCPQNKFGSSGKGKACQNTRVLAILPEGADSSTDMMILSVSPTAIDAFDKYVGNIARTFGVPVRGVVTHISFNPAKEYASVVFGAVAPAEEDMFLVAHSRKQEALDLLTTIPSFELQEVAPPTTKKRPAVAGRR